ncbi:MAG: GNAT family N-acetyltransferase [Pseudomonadota bacterium]
MSDRAPIADITLRPADAADVAEIAGFHVRIWRETYARIAPAEAIAVLDESRRLSSWVDRFASSDPRRQTWLARRDSEIVALLDFGPSSNPVFGDRGEIKHLYVDRSVRGMGLGRRLMATAFDLLAKAGFAGAGLAVVRQNTGAIGFYQACGGREVARFTDPGPIWLSENIVMAWESLDGLGEQRSTGRAERLFR